MADNRLIRDDDDAPAAPVRSEAATPRQTTAKAAPEKPVDKRRGGPYPGRRQVTAHIDRQLFLWLKSISAQTDKPMIVLFEEALSEYVQRIAAQKKFGA